MRQQSLSSRKGWQVYKNCLRHTTKHACGKMEPVAPAKQSMCVNMCVQVHACMW